jgi:23S rRNA pseudouridine1911/1915/1917 synthase
MACISKLQLDWYPKLMQDLDYEKNFKVIFEDNHLIAVHKRAGILVQGDHTGDIPLADLVKEYLKWKYQKTGNVFAGVIHRIDRPVSGLVLIAKTSKALERMNELFRERNIQKTYWALVKNKPPQNEGTLVHYLKKNQEKNTSKAFDTPKDGALKSELHYRCIGQSDRFYLLEIKPITGRHHQIRVQLSKIGCPIKGDVKYGFDRPNPDGSIHLHAKKVDFIHPVKKENMSIECPLPNEKVWQLFSNIKILA